MIKSYKIDAYKKAIKVIESCENENHLKVANQFINNFLLINSNGREINAFNISVLDADEFISSAYVRLRDKYEHHKTILSL